MPGAALGTALRTPRQITQVAGCYNLLPANLPNLIAGMRAMKGGTRNCRIAIDGDSTTWGEGSSGAALTNAKNFCAPTVAAAKLVSSGVRATSKNSWFTSGVNTTANWQTGLSVTLTGSWATQTGTGTAIPATTGGIMVFHTTAADTTALISWVIPENADTCDLWYLQNTGLGSFVYAVDGGADSGVINAAGAASMQKVTIALGSVGAHTLTIRKTNATAAGVYIAAVSAYDSTNKCIELHNRGARTWKISDWAGTSQVWGAGNYQFISTWGVDCILFNIIINDENVTADPAAWVTAMQTKINACKAVGIDMILVMPHPQNTTLSVQATQDAYKAAAKQLAYGNNLPFIDLSYTYPTWTAWSGASLSFDDRHPNTAGASYIGNLYGQILANIYAYA